MLKLCEDIDTLAMMMLDSELAAQEQRDVELHVLDCAACKAHVERERAALELRRRRLAAPPAPALLRARIQRSLDEADRARRPSARRYLLPGAAAFAAVAALALFMIGFQAPAKKTGERAGTTISPPPVQRVEAPRLSLDGRPSDLVLRGAGRELIDPDVARMYYWAELPNGARFDVQVLVVDARDTKVPVSRRRIGRYDVWGGPQEQPTVMVRDRDRVIELGSSKLSARELVLLVGESDLIERIAADDPR